MIKLNLHQYFNKCKDTKEGQGKRSIPKKKKNNEKDNILLETLQMLEPELLQEDSLLGTLQIFKGEKRNCKNRDVSWPGTKTVYRGKKKKKKKQKEKLQLSNSIGYIRIEDIYSL